MIFIVNKNDGRDASTNAYKFDYNDYESKNEETFTTYPNR